MLRGAPRAQVEPNVAQRVAQGGEDQEITLARAENGE
jgi:hypothetical protein